MKIAIDAGALEIKVTETEHTALILYGELLGVFENDHPIMDSLPRDEAIAIEDVGYLYTMSADKRLYDEWRKFVEGRRDSMPKRDMRNPNFAVYRGNGE